MIKMLQTVTEKMEKLNKKIDEKKGNNHENCNNQHVNHRALDNPTFTQRKKYTYYWIRGGHTYCSSVCTSKASDHRHEETFEKKMGGSKGFCD